MTDEQREEYVRLLTNSQAELFAYICALLGGVQEAGNVLQETNLVLWKKAEEFEHGSNFLAWAREVAYFKALSHARDKKRSRLVLDQELVEQVLAAPVGEDVDERRVALRHCLSQLSAPNREILRLRYQQETPLAQIGKAINKTEPGVKMALRRVRLSLMACITKRMCS